MSKTVLGGILLVVGIVLAIAGALAAATFGPSGTLTSTSTPLETTPQGYALVADVVAVSAGFPGSDLLGTPTLGAESAGPERLFVGIGSRADVDEYLAGAPFQAVRQEGDQWQSLSIPGTRNPGIPTDEQIWFARQTGNAPSVDFSTSTGSATFVVMHADGSPDLRAQIVIGYTSPVVFPLSVAVGILGVVLAGVGVMLMRRRSVADSDPSGGESDTTPSAPAATAAPVAATEATEPATTPPLSDSGPQSTTDDPPDVPEGWLRPPADPS